MSAKIAVPFLTFFSGWQWSRTELFRAAALVMLLLVQVPELQAQTRGGSTGSETLEISLSEAVEIARENNLHVRIAKEEVNKIRSQYRETNALLLPDISLEASAVSTNNPLNVFGSLLEQERVTAADFNPATLNNPGQTEIYSTAIHIRQPLFNPGGLTERKAAKEQLEATRDQFTRSREQVEFQVKKTYYGLILARLRTGILDTALVSARANHQKARNFFEQGMAGKADLLAAEVRVRQLENELAVAKNIVERTHRQLGYLLGLDTDTRLVPKGKLETTPAAVPGVILRQVNMNRSDMRALQHRINASEKQLSAGWYGFVPSVNLFGNYKWNDDTLFGTGAGGYLVGATLKWNLFGGFSKVGAIQKSKARLEQVRLQYHDRARQNTIEIKSTMEALETARSRVDLVEVTVEQAAESYRIRRNRHRQGLENMSDLLTAESTLAQTRLQLASARYELKMQSIRLEWLLEQDFTNNK